MIVLEYLSNYLLIRRYSHLTNDYTVTICIPEPFFFLVTSSILSANILQDDQQTKILSLFLYDGMAQVFLEEWL
jgi:hypothetical protein